MIPMSEKKTIDLIRRIEKEPSIWDKKHEGYRSKANKDKAWSRVVKVENRFMFKVNVKVQVHILLNKKKNWTMLPLNKCCRNVSQPETKINWNLNIFLNTFVFLYFYINKIKYQKLLAVLL